MCQGDTRGSRTRTTRGCAAHYGWLRAGLLVGVLSIVTGCDSEAKVDRDTVRPVKVAVVGEASRGRMLSYSGVVRPRIESAVGFRVPGKIVERLVNVGDRVEVDQVIARLDETDLRLSEESARAAVASARSRRDVARDNLERAKALLPKATISQAAYDTRRNEMDAAAAALETAEAQLRQAVNAVGLRYAQGRQGRHRHGGTGRAGAGRQRRPSDRYAWPQAGETEIAVAVPEQDAGCLTIGQPAKDHALGRAPRVSVDGPHSRNRRPGRPGFAHLRGSHCCERCTRRPCGSA